MWNEKQLQQLKNKNRIRDYKISKKRNKNAGYRTENIGNRTKASIQKDWILLNLQYWCNERSLELKTEYLFHPERKWRFDYAIPGLKIAIEYEGIFSKKSRHTTNSGFTNDTEKYNAAAAAGWKVYRYTAKTYKQLLIDLNNL